VQLKQLGRCRQAIQIVVPKVAVRNAVTLWASTLGNSMSLSIASSHSRACPHYRQKTRHRFQQTSNFIRSSLSPDR
jgi:hypothetical protein